MYQQSGLGDKAAKEVADLAGQFEGAVDDLMIVVVLAAVNNVLDGAGDAAAIGAVLAAVAAVIAIVAVVSVLTIVSRVAAVSVITGTTVVAAVSVIAGAAVVAVGTVIAGAAVVAAAAIVLTGVAAGASGLAASVGGVSIEVEVIGEIFHLFVFVKILVLEAEVAAGSKNDDQSYDENADDKQSPILLLHDISPKKFFMPSYTGIIYRYQFTTN